MKHITNCRGIAIASVLLAATSLVGSEAFARVAASGPVTGGYGQGACAGDPGVYVTCVGSITNPPVAGILVGGIPKTVTTAGPAYACIPSDDADGGLIEAEQAAQDLYIKAEQNLITDPKNAGYFVHGAAIGSVDCTYEDTIVPGNNSANAKITGTLGTDQGTLCLGNPLCNSNGTISPVTNSPVTASPAPISASPITAMPVGATLSDQ